MNRKKVSVILMAVMVTSLAAGYTNFEQFDKEKAGITPDSQLYPLDTFSEKMILMLSFSPERKTEKLLGQIRERGSEMEALTYKNKTEEAYEHEKIVTEKIGEMQKVAQKSENWAREEAHNQMRDYMNIRTDSTVYPNELGYWIRRKSSEAYINTSANSTEKVKTALKVSENFENLTDQLISLEMSKELDIALSDYNYSLNILWKHFDNIDGNKTDLLDMVGRSLGYRKKFHIMNEGLEKKDEVKFHHRKIFREKRDEIYPANLGYRMVKAGRTYIKIANEPEGNLYETPETKVARSFRVLEMYANLANIIINSGPEDAEAELLEDRILNHYNHTAKTLWEHFNQIEDYNDINIENIKEVGNRKKFDGNKTESANGLRQNIDDLVTENIEQLENSEIDNKDRLKERLEQIRDLNDKYHSSTMEDDFRPVRGPEPDRYPQNINLSNISDRYIEKAENPEEKLERALNVAEMYAAISKFMMMSEMSESEILRKEGLQNYNNTFTEIWDAYDSLETNRVENFEKIVHHLENSKTWVGNEMKFAEYAGNETCRIEPFVEYIIQRNDKEHLERLEELREEGRDPDFYRGIDLVEPPEEFTKGKPCPYYPEYRID